MSENNNPKIVTLEMLENFKDAFLVDLGVVAANKSIIQVGNNINRTANSLVVGAGHTKPTKDLQNILVSGFSNIVSENNQTVLGVNSSQTTSLFVVGNGANSSNRHNAFEVTRDGVVKGNANMTEDSSADTLVSLGYLNSILTDTALEKLSENITAETISTELQNQLSSINLENAVTTDLYNKLNELSKKFSYLISRLTVAELDEYGEPIKYFAVGLSDAALDFDTDLCFITDPEADAETPGGEE